MMTPFTYLISQTEFRAEISVLNFNLEIDRAAQHFISVQRLKVREILGDKFYDQLVAEKAANTITPDNEKLRAEYLLPYMAFQIVYEFAEQAYGQITNTGAQKFTGVNTQPAEPSYLATMKRSAGSTANAYAAALTKYLKENQSKYPLWGGCSVATQTPVNCGIWINPKYK